MLRDQASAGIGPAVVPRGDSVGDVGMVLDAVPRGGVGVRRINRPAS
jgi:hypothetical protein